MVPAKIYFKQKELFQSLINLTESDLIKVGRTLRNIVENPNMPSTDADEALPAQLSFLLLGKFLLIGLEETDLTRL